MPIIQRSAAGYLADPGATNALIVKLTQDYDAYPYSAERAAYAAKVMKDNGIVGNGPTGRIGNFDLARVTKLLDIVRPVFAKAATPLPAGLTARRRGHQRVHRPQGRAPAPEPAVIWLSPRSRLRCLSDPEFTL